MRPVRVYVSGPYSSDPERNTENAIAIADELLKAGFAPYVPHLTHFWHARYPHEWKEWIDFDLVWLPLCHVLYSYPGESRGADIEVARALELGMPVFYRLSDLFDWRGSILSGEK